MLEGPIPREWLALGSIVSVDLDHRVIHRCRNRQIVKLLTIDYTLVMLKVVLSEEFKSWLSGLKDPTTRRRLLLRLRKASLGHLGDVKPVSSGVYEMREFFGPGWRMYYVRRGNLILMMLGGGTKATQARDVENAVALAQLIGDQQDAEKN